jgi:5'-nucleotidase
MKTTLAAPAAVGKKTFTLMSRETLSRRELLAGSAAVGAMVVLRGEPATAADGKKTFTILHTNDLHSNLIGMGPALDYTPFIAGVPPGYKRILRSLAPIKVTRPDLSSLAL